MILSHKRKSFDSAFSLFHCCFFVEFVAHKGAVSVVFEITFKLFPFLHEGFRIFNFV